MYAHNNRCSEYTTLAKIVSSYYNEHFLFENAKHSLGYSTKKVEVAKQKIVESIYTHIIYNYFVIFNI